MKKSLLLGLSALVTAAAWAPMANAGEIKLGGFYQGRWQVYDNTMTKEASPTNEGEGYVQRLQLQADMKASEKSNAHLVVRVLDNNTVEGADLGSVSDIATTATPGLAAWNRVSPAANNAMSNNFWEIRQAWLETEAWGVGIKFGNMPLTLNDSILVGDDTSGNGGLLLSKTFGNVTVVAGNIRINEGTSMGTARNNTLYSSGQDDSNLWAASAFGKVGLADYNATLAYADIGKVSDFQNALNAATGNTAGCTAANPNCNGSNNLWAALTLSGKIGYVNAVGTVIYENGYDLKSNTAATAGSKVSSQFADSGALVALRLSGNTNFGEWNAYGFTASKGFNNITNDNTGWSPTWAQDGPGTVDLLNTFANSAGKGALSSASGMTANSNWTSPSENMSGIGVGLKIKSAGWTINPMVDYAQVTRSVTGDNFKSAAGGSLLLTTQIQKDTTLMLEAAMIRPTTASGATVTSDNPYYAQASIKMAF
ncbi:MAG: hypothetical protein HQL73_00265 [Magnetococcales bacterium]|nr:hypothetical protein [Magnetococcales bacterium]